MRGVFTTAEDRYRRARRSGRPTRAASKLLVGPAPVSAGCGRGTTTRWRLQPRRGRASCRSCFSSARAARGRRAGWRACVAWVKVTQKTRLRVVEVDGDRRLDVVRRFGIREFPSLVLIVRRRVVGRLEGKATGNEIERLLRTHLRPEAPPRPL